MRIKHSGWHIYVDVKTGIFFDKLDEVIRYLIQNDTFFNSGRINSYVYHTKDNNRKKFYDSWGSTTLFEDEDVIIFKKVDNRKYKVLISYCKPVPYGNRRHDVMYREYQIEKVVNI